MRNEELFRMACLFAGILSLLLLIPSLPLAFKHVAYWAISPIAIWAAAGAATQFRYSFVLLLAAAAFVFNPIVQVNQTAQWMWASDVAAALLFFASSQVVNVSNLRWPGSIQPDDVDLS